MGFCLFNNVAIAAAWLLDAAGPSASRSWTTTSTTATAPRTPSTTRADVLYISTHQYPLYPGTGHWHETGAGAGEGYTINLALPPGLRRRGLRCRLDAIIEPAVRRYEPDFILVSLGFDAFWADPLASLRLSIAGAYTPLLRSARDLAAELCGGRLVVALEGGYDLDALAHGAEAVAGCCSAKSQPPIRSARRPTQLPLRPGRAAARIARCSALHNLV